MTGDSTHLHHRCREFAITLVQKHAVFITVQASPTAVPRIAYIGPPSGGPYEFAQKETSLLGLSGDAEVLMHPMGVRGLVDDEAMDLVNDITRDLAWGFRLTPYLDSAAIRKVKRGRTWHDEDEDDEEDDSDGEASNDDKKPPAKKKQRSD